MNVETRVKRQALRRTWDAEWLRKGVENITPINKHEARNQQAEKHTRTNQHGDA